MKWRRLYVKPNEARIGPTPVLGAIGPLISLCALGCQLEHGSAEPVAMPSSSSEVLPSAGPIVDRDAAAGSVVEARIETVLGDTPLDPSVRAAYVRRSQLEGGPEFHVQRRAQLVTAENAPHGLEVEFDRARVVIAHRTPQGSRADAIVELDGIGRAGATREHPPIQEMRSDGPRVEYRRGRVVEWYVNGPLGLEQGFVFAGRPVGDGKIEITLDVQGDLLPELSADGRSIELRDERTARLAVSELHVSDRDGKTLPSSIEVRDGQIVIAFEDDAAAYPVEVDPLYAAINEQKGPSDAQSHAEFGSSVVYDGTRVVIGAPNHGRTAAGAADGTGAAYIFEKSAGGLWQQVAKLAPAVSAESRGGRFGEAVAISGNVVIVGAPGWNGLRGKWFAYRRDSSGTWPLDFEVTGTTGNDRVGASVSLANGRLLIGNPGKAVGGVINRGTVSIYRDMGPRNWSLRNGFATPAGITGFGTSVAQAGRFIAVGVPSATIPGFVGAGVVFFWKESGAPANDTFQSGGLLECGPEANGSCGAYLAMGIDSTSAEILVVSEPGASTRYMSRGSVTVFTANSAGNAWTSQALTLTPEQKFGGVSHGPVSFFQQTVGTETRMHIVVGYAASPINHPPIDVFERSDGSWSRAFRLPPVGAGGDAYGRAVAMGFDHVIVGAPFDNQLGGTRAGKAYFFGIGLNNGASCLSSNQCASKQCVDGVCCNSSCGGGALDCQVCSVAAGGTENGSCTPMTAAAAAAVTCRAANGACDVAERCIAASTACPANVFAPNTTQCRAAAAGGCDVAERCTGTSAACPADGFANSATTCRAAAGGCDVAERCTGSSPTCPANALASSGTTCRPIAGVCDVAETCNGSTATCPTDAFVPPDVLVCRDSVDLCDYAELCSGTSASCPPQLPPPPWCL